MRDRLIELIGSKICEDYSPTCDEWQPHSCEKCYANDCKIGELADTILADGWMRPPCKVGEKFYRIEKWCTEGGFWEEPKRPYSSTCEDCCEECDGEEKIEEYTFNSIIQILELERYFGEYVYLTKEEAEQALTCRDSRQDEKEG